jgi:hypothetical protein
MPSSTLYSVQFFDVLTEGDATGFIDTPVVTLAATGSHTFSLVNNTDFLGQSLMIRTHGKPMVAVVTIRCEVNGEQVSQMERFYFIGDPGNAVAVRFGGPMGDCKPFALHDYDDDSAIFDLGRTAAN